MITTKTAYTREIDDCAAAVADLLAQLDLAADTSHNKVGIISCHYEFVFSGLVSELCGQLPFPVIGIISSANAVRDAADMLMLSIMVLSSDKVSFSTSLSSSLLEDAPAAIAEAYRAAAADHEERPALILSFAGFLQQNSGDQYVAVLNEISQGIPCFGSLAVDDTADFANSYAIYNSEHHRDRMALLLIYGDIKPRFYTATISADKIIAKAALITSSEGHILKEVNGRPIVDYFTSLGLTKASETSYAMTSLPFMLDYNDGTPPVSRVFVGLNEQLHAICAGAMPEGATMYIGVFDDADVLLTTRLAIQQALAESTPSCVLSYSCIARLMAMGSNTTGEMDMVRELLAAAPPFLMSCSGGEICPTNRQDTLINRFHNNTFTLCVF